MCVRARTGRAAAGFTGRLISTAFFHARTPATALNILALLLGTFVQFEVALIRSLVCKGPIALLAREVRALVRHMVLGEQVPCLEVLATAWLLAWEALPVRAVLELVLLQLIVILHQLVAHLALERNRLRLRLFRVFAQHVSHLQE